MTKKHPRKPGRKSAAEIILEKYRKSGRERMRRYRAKLKARKAANV